MKPIVAATWFVLGLRLLWLSVLLRFPDWTTYSLAAVELLTLALSAYNAATSKHWDESPGAWLTIGCYLSAFALIPQGRAGELVAAYSVLQLVLLLQLGTRYSCGGNNWRGLCDTGFYAIVRHPMKAAFLATRCAAVVAWPSWWNVLVLLLTCALGGLQIAAEEKYLRQWDEWALYALKVRWRLLPGVW